MFGFFIFVEGVEKTTQHILVTLAVGIALLPIHGLAAPGLYPDVRVIESTENSITLEFTPRYTSGQKVLGDGRTYQTDRV